MSGYSLASLLTLAIPERFLLLFNKLHCSFASTWTSRRNLINDRARNLRFCYQRMLLPNFKMNISSRPSLSAALALMTTLPNFHHDGSTETSTYSFPGSMPCSFSISSLVSTSLFDSIISAFSSSRHQSINLQSSNVLTVSICHLPSPQLSLPSHQSSINFTSPTTLRSSCQPNLPLKPPTTLPATDVKSAPPPQ